jgi:hypothetical protein
MRGRGDNGFGRGGRAVIKPLVTKKQKNEERAQRRQALVDRFDPTKMSGEELQRFAREGKFGCVRPADCTTCGGKGEGPYGDCCDDCICGGCGGEKFDCGGCYDEPGMYVSSDSEESEELEPEDEDEDEPAAEPKPASEAEAEAKAET